jgi:hypothetical protein
MLNHTYTSVKNANLVDCGKKQHIPSQPSPLLKDNFLGEFRTELDKKKVLANLGIATSLSLEWANIKGNIGDNKDLIGELNARTTYVTEIGDFQGSVISIVDGIKYLETIVGGEQEGEDGQNQRLTALETLTGELVTDLEEVKEYLTETVEVDIDKLEEDLGTITEKVNNITDLIQVSSKAGNALRLVGEDELAEGETPGLYVPDLSDEVSTVTDNVTTLQTEVKTILDTYVTKEQLGGGEDGFNFVDESTYNSFVNSTSESLSDIREELSNTVKTGADGHVNALYVNEIGKNNNDGNIKITDSFEVTEGIPLDVRCVVKSLDDLHALDPKICYAGMGVIVTNQSSLYILREPLDGIIDETYIQDAKGENWKCPEDLVIEVITKDDYDKKVEEGSINQHMFYYIYEEITEEPNPKDYVGGSESEAYKEALDRWLHYLQGQYMSAVWGQEIEKLVAEKASNKAIKSLEEEIQRITALIGGLSGGSEGINLKDLNDQILENKTNIESVIGDEGSLPKLQEEVKELSNTLTSDYVTKSEITEEDPNKEYIFVKKSAFENYTDSHSKAIAEKVTTNEVVTTRISLGEDSITTSEGSLLVNNEKLALEKQVPIIELKSDYDYNQLPEKDSDVYYYIYDTTERYVLASEYDAYKNSLTRITNALSESVSNVQLSIGLLSNLTTENKNTLVYAINELHTYISNTSNTLSNLMSETGAIAQIQTSVSNLTKEMSTKYVTIESITKEDPEVEYIFVKKSEFDLYKQEQSESFSDSINTKELTTDKLNTPSINLDDDVITSVDSTLVFNEKPLAFLNQIPKIEVLDQTTYDSKDKDVETYYMVYDTTDRYVSESELLEYKTNQTQALKGISDLASNNQMLIGNLLNLETDNKNTLVLAINELVNKINTLTQELNTLKEKLG